MFGIPATFIAGAAIAAASAGGAWYVMDLRSDLSDCRATLTTQSDAIDAMREEGAKTTGALRKALEAGKPAASAAAARVAARKAVPAPSSCDAAFDLLDAP